MTTIASIPEATPEHVLKAFEMANDYAEQLLTLSTGIIAFTAGIAKDWATMGQSRSRILRISWAFYLLSVISGVMHIQVLVGTMANASELKKGLEGSLAAQVQAITFALGTIFIILFGTGWPRSQGRHASAGAMSHETLSNYLKKHGAPWRAKKVGAK